MNGREMIIGQPTVVDHGKVISGRFRDFSAREWILRIGFQWKCWMNISPRITQATSDLPPLLWSRIPIVIS